jgi:hypothetical protein
MTEIMFSGKVQAGGVIIVASFMAKCKVLKTIDLSDNRCL